MVQGTSVDGNDDVVRDPREQFVEDVLADDGAGLADERRGKPPLLD